MYAPSLSIQKAIYNHINTESTGIIKEGLIKSFNRILSNGSRLTCTTSIELAALFNEMSIVLPVQWIDKSEPKVSVELDSASNSLDLVNSALQSINIPINV